MYVCNNCGGGLRFDPKLQKLLCDHCGSSLNVTDALTEREVEESEELEAKVFRCPNCGGQIYTLDETVATFCSYCGSSNILDSKLEGIKKPKVIIPFKYSKQDCVDIYRKAVKHAIFAPKELKNPKYLDRFRGIYTPYWVYDTKIDTRVHLNGEESHRSGDYRIEETYDLSANVKADFSGISYDASSSFDDDISAEVAPYPENQFQKFNDAYLSGFYADVPDVDYKVYMPDSADFTVKRVMGNVKGAFPEVDRITPVPGGFANALHPECEEPSSAMFPVWFLSYRNRDRVAYGVVNGATGKASIDMPISPLKYLLFSLIIAIPVFFLLNMGLTLTPSAGLIFSMILTFVTSITYLVNRSRISKKENRVYDKGYNSVHGEVDERSVRKAKGGMLSGIILPAIALLIAVFMLIVDPVSDIFYYGANIFLIVVTALTIIRLIKQYNVLATRPLPQFSKERGEADA